VTSPGGTSAAISGDHYSYDAQPTVTAVTPSAGPMAAATQVTITGTGFTGSPGAVPVLFTALPATSYVVVNSTTITAVVPAQSAGLYNIHVTTLEGRATRSRETITPTTRSRRSPRSPRMWDHHRCSTVTITGKSFTGATKWRSGKTAAASFSVVNSTTITVAPPAHSAERSISMWTSPGGTSATFSGDHFTYHLT